MSRLKSCKYCGCIHPAGHVCDKRPKRVYKRSEAEHGRYTGDWTHKVEEIKSRSHYLCAYCRSQGILTYEGLEVHHIIKLRDRPELLLEDSNLVCLCVRHHKEADRGEIDAKVLYALVRQRDNIPPEGEGQSAEASQNHQRPSIYGAFPK